MSLPSVHSLQKKETKKGMLMFIRPVFCLGAAHDESCPPEAHCLPWVEKLRKMGGNVVYETLETDHSFSDVRLTMIDRKSVV